MLKEKYGQKVPSLAESLLNRAKGLSVKNALKSNLHVSTPPMSWLEWKRQQAASAAASAAATAAEANGVGGEEILEAREPGDPYMGQVLIKAREPSGGRRRSKKTRKGCRKQSKKTRRGKKNRFYNMKGGALSREELIEIFMDFYVTAYMIMSDKYEEDRGETNKGFNKLNDIVSWLVSKEVDFSENILREAIKRVMADGVSYEKLKEVADMGEIKLTKEEINNYFSKEAMTENEEFLIQYVSVGLGEQLESFNQYNIPPLTPPPSSPVAAAAASPPTEN